MRTPNSYRILGAFSLFLALTPVGFAQYSEHDPIVIQKDAQGRLSPDEEAELQDAYSQMGQSAASVWIAARVNFNPDAAPDSPEGVAQQHRIDSAIEAILRRLARKGFDTRPAERTDIGPYLALPLTHDGIEELVADRAVEVLYIMLPAHHY